ncbi:hypothetical protein [Spiroplasma endosymbiont of Aspidapion aeneum]|uniref:hypothetical protein n=1 Tax=Spiroplasma endosymbiont of Aspidapion aeneum TaxID=3066276 RepID=UPI00313EB537
MVKIESEEILNKKKMKKLEQENKELKWENEKLKMQNNVLKKFNPSWQIHKWRRGWQLNHISIIHFVKYI